jgi:transposase-like protein
MRWKQHKPEQIVEKLDRVAKAVKRGSKLAEVIKAEGICEATYFRWRALYGGLKPAQLARYRDLEVENARLRKLLDDIESSDQLLRA